MDRLGPFEPRPVLGVAVSGGADSMALAILARDWVRRRDGSAFAFVVDHGLRPTSAEEARTTVARLSGLEIPAMVVALSNLKHGPGLAERARIRRYEALADACREHGILHLLLGHHAADQIETLAMRVLRGSQTHGLAGIAALRELTGTRLLRPLLGTEPARLRGLLIARRVDWIEDPSNRDIRALRPRLRHRRAASDDPGLLRAMAGVGKLRSDEEAEVACELAQRVTVWPAGFALLSPGRIGSGAMSRLVRTISGASYPPAPAQIDELAAQPRPATLGGVRIMSAGRFGDGLLVVREEAAVMGPVDACPETIWDHRFRLHGGHDLRPGATIGKLGADAARFRGKSTLPSVVLRTLPAIRRGEFLAAVPHLNYTAGDDDPSMTVVFTPPHPLAGACFVPGAGTCPSGRAPLIEPDSVFLA